MKPMKTARFLLTLAMVAVGCGSFLTVSAAPGQAPPSVNKYGIKSGIVTYDTSMEMGSMKIPGKIVLYFDDYGMKENQETYKDGALSESFISDGKDRFKLYHADKMTVMSGKAYSGVAMKFDWNDVSQKDKDAGAAKAGPKETVAGKECETFTVLTKTGGQDTTTIYAGWNHILLSMRLSTKTMSSTQVAVKVEENATVPADKFKAPAGYVVK